MAPLQTLIEHRVLVSLALSLGAALIGPRVFPFPANNPLLRLVEAERPSLFHLLAHG